MMKDQALRRLLRFDFALCLACGLPGILAPGWLAAFLLPGQESLFGFPMPTVMLELGILLAAYAILLLGMSFRAAVPKPFVTVTAAGDAAWVLGTIALLLAYGSAFSLWGSIALLVVAVDTALIGVAKARVLRGAVTPAAA